MYPIGARERGLLLKYNVWDFQRVNKNTSNVSCEKRVYVDPNRREELREKGRQTAQAMLCFKCANWIYVSILSLIIKGIHFKKFLLNSILKEN